MPISAEQALAQVQEVVARHPERPLFIGIDGPGGAGKSTLAEVLAGGLPDAEVVHVDDLSAPAFDEWDVERGRRQVIEPLLRGEPARYQRWDWDRDEGAEWIDVPANSIVIVEGVSATRDELGAPWLLRLWVETPRELRLRRALDRDGEAMMPVWLERWIPSEERYFAAQDPRGRADLVVSGDRGLHVGESRAL